MRVSDVCFFKVDKRGLPLPSTSTQSSLVGSTGGMLKGLLMRRQSSQVSAYDDQGSSSGYVAGGGAGTPSSADGSDVGVVETIYGDPSSDVGDEVRFYVELTRLDRLTNTYSLDVRRLKGNLRSYKFLYDTIRECVFLSFLFSCS
jgi:protein-serine/threonine kinase